MTGLEWPEVLPVLAARVAADSGRPLAEVEEFLGACYRAEPEDVDVERLAELLAPTMTAIMGSALLDVLSRLERVAPDDRMPVLAPIALGILPVILPVIVPERRGARG